MLVLDANILVRAVLGKRVRELLARYGRRVDFFVPEVMVEEAREVLPGILRVRGIPAAPAIEYLVSLSGVVHRLLNPSPTQASSPLPVNV